MTGDRGWQHADSVQRGHERGGGGEALPGGDGGLHTGRYRPLELVHRARQLTGGTHAQRRLCSLLPVLWIRIRDPVPF